MKKIIVILIIFFASSLEAAIPLQFEFRVSRNIEEKYRSMFYRIVRYWVEENTNYRITDKSASSRLTVTLQQRLNQYVLEAMVEEKNQPPSQDSITFYNLTEFFDSLDRLFYQSVFDGKIMENRKDYLFAPEFTDVLFLVDSTGSMKEEVLNLQQCITEILSPVFWNRKTRKIRFALADYKNPESRYRIQLENFDLKTEPFLKRLHSIRAVGKGEGDLKYALRYIFRYGDWKASERMIFLITDSTSLNSGELDKLLEEARKMSIRVFFLAADGIEENPTFQYEKIFKKHLGNFFHLSYTLTYLLMDNTLKKYLYHQKKLHEVQGEEKTDITLGRKVENLDKIVSFLEYEGVPIQQRKQMEIDFTRIIEKILAPDRKSLPVGIFESDGKTLHIGVQDKRLYRTLKSLKNKTLIIGGQFFPYSGSVSIVPHTLTLSDTIPPGPLFQPIEKIIEKPLFYFNKGLFEPSLWFIRAVFKGFE